MSIFSTHNLHLNGQDIHVKMAGPDDAPVMLMLHGFPEYWVAWSAVAERFADRYRVVLPDQRGYNLSSRPLDRADYDTKHLVADMVALADTVSPDQPVILCGHDWGASVAYAMAMRHADRVSHLIIANGVHPMCFQKGLYSDADQRRASQYMNVLRAEGSEERLSANRYEKLLGMFEKFSAAPWLDEAERDAFRTAWSQPDALPAMLNWYRESPMEVLSMDEPLRDFPITQQMIERYRITMPHLLLWGEQDTALTTASREDLPRFCEDLTVVETADASHWILHERPDWVAAQMEEFLKARSVD